MISKTVMVGSSGLTAQFMKEPIKMERSTAMAHCLLLMVVCTTANSTLTIFKAKVFINGMMEKYTMENG